MKEGVPGCVTKCDRGKGSKLAKNNVTYFMDGPKAGKLSSIPKSSYSKIAKTKPVGILFRAI